ncbi:MAG: S49 family peptidase [Elusimicrobiota bacterium]
MRLKTAAIAALGIGLIHGGLLLARAVDKQAESSKVVIIHVDDEITLGLSAYIRRALKEAKDAQAVILRVDTFGGRVDAALTIAKAAEKPKIPVIAWVEDKAWSAGALISLACDKIYMAKSSSIGSAMPVTGGAAGKTTAVGSSAPVDEPPVSELPVGRKGLTLMPLSPVGRAQFGTHIIEARANSGTIAKGTQIEIAESGKIPVVHAAKR